MKRFLLTLVTALAVLAPLVASGDHPAATARHLYDLLAAGRWQEATALFDSTMSAALPPDKLAATWRSLTEQVGAPQEVLGTREQPYGKYRIAFVTVRFTGTALDMKVVLDQQGKVAGLFFQPAADTGPPPYADPARYTEQDVTVGAPGWPLPGTLTLPRGDGPFPAVVLVHGSGPADRDETIGPNKPLRDLAWGLASRGIAVLRYEKRTRYYQKRVAQLVGDSLTVDLEAVDDAVAAVSFLRRATRVDSMAVFVAGHSQGALLAPRIAVRSPRLAGLVLLAPPGRPLAEMILAQSRYLAERDGTVDEQEQQQLDRLAAQVARVRVLAKGVAVPADSLPYGLPPAYWASLRGYDAVATARRLAAPLLILRGERDYQVTDADLKTWRDGLAGRDGVTIVELPGLNHLFMPGEGAPGPEEYQQAGHVSPAVVERVATWIHDVSRRQHRGTRL